MAAPERANVTQQMIEGNDGTLRGALEVWVAETGPKIYNQWQSAWHQLVRPPWNYADNQRPPNETQAQLPVSYTHLTLPTTPYV